MNSVNLLGRLTKEPDLKYAGKEGIAICTVTIAVNRKYKSAGQPEADFILIKAFRKTAELLANVKKGEMLGIEGSWQTGSYDDKEGKRQYTNDCVVESITFTGGKNNNDSESQQPGNTNSQYNSKKPGGADFGSHPDPFEKGSHPVNISDDDLPF